MTVDRKRLRDLALAAKRFRESWPNERPSDRPLHAEFTDSKHDEIILELLDALDAAEQPAPDDARLELEWLWANCHIVYWPKGDPQPYPIEHNLRASKNSRDLIEAAIAEQAQERTP